ncbi:solute carrier family 43 member 3-like [Myripristis murdjan]|uniref:solute carrier family 43 member 3-like n=1 Tax=Myripristis murdjan TaxID=586833 RepID=UPI001175CF5B|nr:solute carrier family 43 member 3-like [Myripristis murdjan]
MLECCGGKVKVRHWLTLLTGFMESLCCTGIAYGWASLVYVLKLDGYFAEKCVNATGKDQLLYTDCSGQDEQLSWVMLVALISNNIVRFPIGYIFDSFGTTVTRLLAIFLYASGTLCIMLSTADLSVLLHPALSCLMTSGSILYVTNAQVGNLFDTHRSTVITVYTGAFDSSAVVFLIIKLLYERGVSLYSSFLFLFLCSTIHLLRTIFLMPRRHIPYPVPENYTYGVHCPGPRRGRAEEERGRKDVQREDVEKFKTNEGAVANSLDSSLLDKVLYKPQQEEVPSFWSCMMTQLFLWHLLWFAIVQFCHNIFVATVNPMLSRLADSDQSLVSHYTNAYAFTQLCGMLCAPLNGLIMDRHKGRPLAPGETRREADLSSSSLALLLTSFKCFLFCVCFSCPILPLQYVSFILQVINSAFLYGGHQAFLCIAFPMCHFGKLSGLVMSLSTVTLLLQFPVLHLIQHQLHGDPLFVNVALTLLSLLTCVHPIHIYLHCRNQRRAKREGNRGG